MKNKMYIYKDFDNGFIDMVHFCIREGLCPLFLVCYNNEK